MSTASERTIHVLEQIVKDVPVGTNLALLQLIWAMLSGAFLNGRGAVFAALQWAGFTASQIRRCAQALRCGAWDMDALVAAWRAYVLNQGAWQPHCYEGYCPLAVDLSTFARPRLKGWSGKFFHHLVQRAIPGIGVGVVVQVGQVGAQRIALLKQLICARESEQTDCQLKRRVLQAVREHLAPQEVVVHDAGASIADMQAAELERFVVRLACNATARRNQLPARKAKGRTPEYGTLIRPLARQFKKRTLPATPPDVETTFVFQERTIVVQGWCELVRADQKVAPDHATFTVWAFFDPLYRDPLLLATKLAARPETVFRLYLDRWPVEQVPLVAKQLLGLQRQFVFAATSRQRLPQLALLAANILTYLAAVLPPLPTGFWDRQPQRTPGRLRRVLAQTGFPQAYPWQARIRVKRSVTTHLPKGVAAHRRQRAP
jgi:hypothetical protein